MKCQSLSSGKIKMISLLSAEFAQRVVKIRKKKLELWLKDGIKYIFFLFLH